MSRSHEENIFLARFTTTTTVNSNMAPKKPAKPNAFIMFAQDLMGQQGRKFNSLKEAVDAAAPLWARMGKDQRKPYEDKAKDAKGQLHPTRYTSEGLDVEELTREEKLKNQLEEKARQDIRNIITLAYRRGEEVMARETFFVIHCNIFCHYPPSDRYWPAEISVLSFSLKDGVKKENTFHYLVQPGPLPIGHKFEAKQHSDKTHLLNVPFDIDPENNQEEIYFNLKAFLEKKKDPSTKQMPILFADKKWAKMIQKILNTWCEDYDTEEELFKIYNLQEMFYCLRNTVAGEPVWSSLAFSDRELEKDVYAYVPEIACEVHAATSKPFFCSQSIVLRYAFMICDNCCPDLNIELKPGRHVPLASTIPDSGSLYSNTTTIGSDRSSNFGGRSGRGFDSDVDTESNAETWDTYSMISNSSSTVTTTNLDDEFPSLGKSGFQSQNSEPSSFTPNSSSVKSYAGATGRSTLPSAFERHIQSMSISSEAPIGRGFRRRFNDSDCNDASSVVGAPAATFSGTNNSDFPPIGGVRGRGFIAKRLQKPGVENNK